MPSKEARNYVAKSISEYPNILKNISKPLAIDHQEPEIKARQKQLEFIEAFETTFVQLDTEKKKMIQYMYWAREQYNCQAVGMKLYVDGSTIGRWRNNVLNQVAERMGLQ